MAHPIGGLMQTTLENMKEMVDVNTVIGEPIETSGGATVIPVSKVSFGFVAGGGEYDLKTLPGTEDMPFAGGSGAGVSVQPVGFLVVQDGAILLDGTPQEVFSRRDIFDGIGLEVPQVTQIAACASEEYGLWTSEALPITMEQLCRRIRGDESGNED